MNASDPSAYEVELAPLGEIRMGLDGYGMILRSRDRVMRALEEEPVFTSPKPAIERGDNLSAGGRGDAFREYLVIHGLFSTYVVDMEDWTLSLFRSTIRGQTADGQFFWTDENPIFGAEFRHFNTEQRHYFVQYPFVPDEEFRSVWNRYHELRVSQIRKLIARE